MTKFIKYFNIALFVFFVLCLGFFLGKKYDIVIDNENQVYILKNKTDEKKIKRLLNLIESEYLENVDSDSLVDFAITEILAHLDPYSTYMDSLTSLEMQKTTLGTFKGYGISFVKVKDQFYVTQVIPKSPLKNKVFAGDIMLSLGKTHLKGKSIDEVFEIFNAAATKETLLIKRKYKEEAVAVFKTDIEYSAILSAYMINSTTGYVKISRFSKGVAQDFHATLDDLQSKGMTTLVLDLRDNAGGLLSEAKDIIDEFLPSNTLMVSVVDKEGNQSDSYATRYGLYETGKVFVYINENSASASEVLAGALQDHKRATIVGRKSYGKGLVQSEVPFGDGSKVRLTIATYYTPSGKNIQRPYKTTKQQNNPWKSPIQGSHLTNAADSTSTIQEEGGILPDITVPFHYELYHNSFFNAGGIDVAREFLLDYLHQHPEAFYAQQKKDYIKNSQVGLLWIPFQNYCKTIGFQWEEKDNLIAQKFLKAQMAFYVYDSDAYYQIWNTLDPYFQSIQIQP